MLFPVLTAIIAFFVCLSLWMYDFDFTAPPVLFAGGFLFSALWGIAYSGVWAFRMHLNAFVAIGAGVAFFVGACLLLHRLFAGLRPWCQQDDIFDRDPSPLPLLVFLILQIIVLAQFVVRIRQMFPSESLSESISLYKYAGTFTTVSTNLGFPLQQLREFCYGGAYVTAYYAVRGISRHKLSVATIVATLSVLANCAIRLAGGGRTMFAVYLIMLVAFYFFERRERHEGSIGITWKMCLALAMGVAAFLVSFRLLAIGRSDNNSLAATLSSLSVYIGSEIPNLDHWMQLGIEPKLDVWGAMTFIDSIHFLGAKLHIPGWGYTLDLPYLSTNWHWMGNVYTTFYAFLYDFGFPGLVGCTVLMAVASELFYALAGTAQRFRPFWKIMYACIAPHLLLSFFSNKVYENVLTLQFYRMLFDIVVLLLILNVDWKGVLQRVVTLAMGVRVHGSEMRKDEADEGE